MQKELHIWVTKGYPEGTLTTYHETNKAFDYGLEVIHTTQTNACHALYLAEGYRIFVHMVDGECVEIKKGSGNKNTKRTINFSHNLEKLLLANEFGMATVNCNKL